MKLATATRFQELCRRAGIADDDGVEVFEDLLTLYSEDHRSYHNLSHIDRMLFWMDASGGGSDSLELAIWFHDAVYDPMGKVNEANSARYFADRLGSCIGAELIDSVVRLILATDLTRPRSGRDDEDLMIDIDRSILGSSPDDYEAYRAAVRKEYPSVSDEDFSEGRKAVLQEFLADRIYATEFFSKFERQARVNIENEVTSLDACGCSAG